MKPIIGMVSDELVEVNPRMPDDHLVYAPHDIKEAVYKVGGIPLILPFADDPSDADAVAEQMVDRFDALIVPGGPDVDPLLYGEEPIPAMGIAMHQQDVLEIAMIKATLKANKPILGICRGIQLINVALGGTLWQDLNTQPSGATIQHTQVTLGHYLTHHVTMTPNSRLQQLLGDTQVVNSRHHQAVHTVAPSLKVTATAPDGIIEGLESTDNDRIVCVQWHPENLWFKHPVHLSVFQDLIARIHD